MTDMQPLEIVPSGDEWAVQRQKAERALKTFDTKAKAQDYGSELAKSEKSALIIKNSDGQVQESRDYGD